MLDLQYIAERVAAIEANLKQVAETLVVLGEASARGLEQAARTLEDVVEQLERRETVADQR